MSVGPLLQGAKIGTDFLTGWFSKERKRRALNKIAKRAAENYKQQKGLIASQRDRNNRLIADQATEQYRQVANVAAGERSQNQRKIAASGGNNIMAQLASDYSGTRAYGQGVNKVAGQTQQMYTQSNNSADALLSKASQQYQMDMAQIEGQKELLKNWWHEPLKNTVATSIGAVAAGEPDLFSAAFGGLKGLFSTAQGETTTEESAPANPATSPGFSLESWEEYFLNKYTGGQP